VTRDEFERLIRVEAKLEVVEERLTNFKDDNDRRLDELRNMLVALSAPPAPKAPPTVLEWVSQNYRPILIIIALVTGGTSLIEALKLLGQ
jgi:hypothetical protein